MVMDSNFVVNTVASRLNVDNGTAQKVVGTILSMLEHEAGMQNMTPLLNKLPGSAELAQQYDVMATPAASTGLLGSIASAFGASMGERAGALVNGMRQLEASGLTLAQVQQAGTSLLEQARVAAGPKAVASIMASAPGLAGHLGN